MGKSILITGGARSGKSSYAEKLAKELGGNVLYIATSIPFDEEMKLRVKRHKESRPREWDTFEG
ncbi:MAG TPA: bifunctional adenosylcobinamide kinase/adenosylcobinamide-phosphate guanylyltransferase, partial [Bacillota bacterium]|nr:bifunctional adenosylcobinamide kinase/adenosylcobinamide-phosphate guanylyltransferase [Bacillota bacterium]